MHLRNPSRSAGSWHYLLRIARPIELSAVSLLATGTIAAAQTTSLQARPPEDARPGPNLLPDLPDTEMTQAPISWEAGLAMVPHYIARGLIYSAATSAQPYGSVTVAMRELSTGDIADPHLTLGGWASMQAAEPGMDQRNSGSMKGWYEQDLYASIGATILRDWSIAANYYSYLSPARSFDGYSEAQIAVRFDDRRFWANVKLREFTLSPSLLVAREVGRPARPDATYIEPAIAPSFTLGGEDRTLRLAFPIALGLSDNFFDGTDGGKHTFGFARAGILLSGVPFPQQLDWLTLDAGVDQWMPNRAVDHGLRDKETVFHIGLRAH